jgi:hypothetical protein
MSDGISVEAVAYATRTGEGCTRSRMAYFCDEDSVEVDAFDAGGAG